MRMKFQTFLALLPLSLAHAVALAAEPMQYPLQSLSRSSECKLDDATVVKLLYLNCVATREAGYNAYHKEVKCLDAEAVAGRLVLDSEFPVSVPKHVRKARLALHAHHKKMLAENPDPLEILRELQANKSFERCPVSVLFWVDGPGSSFGHPNRVRYETDLADALGLSFNARTISLIEKLHSDATEHVLPPDSHRGYSRIKRNLEKLERNGERLVPALEEWMEFTFNGSIMGGWLNPVTAILDNSLERLLRAHGDPKMTEARIATVITHEDGRKARIHWTGWSLWRAPLSSLVPAEDKAGLLVSDLVLDALPMNYWLTKANTSRSGSMCTLTDKKGKNCKWMDREKFQPNNEEK